MIDYLEKNNEYWNSGIGGAGVRRESSLRKKRVCALSLSVFFVSFDVVLNACYCFREEPLYLQTIFRVSQYFDFSSRFLPTFSLPLFLFFLPFTDCIRSEATLTPSAQRERETLFLPQLWCFLLFLFLASLSAVCVAKSFRLRNQSVSRSLSRMRSRSIVVCSKYVIKMH